MKTLTTILIIILILIGTYAIISSTITVHKNSIEKWAKENKLEVKTIKLHQTIINTPFLYKNDASYIYEVDMTNNEKWWVRTNIFNNDYIKDDDTNSQNKK